MARTSNRDDEEAPLPRCAQCERESDDLSEYHDRYGIYAGRYCSDQCFEKTSYASFVFVASYAGESLEEPD